jgi:hypothetical protein
MVFVCREEQQNIDKPRTEFNEKLMQSLEQRGEVRVLRKVEGNLYQCKAQSSFFSKIAILTNILQNQKMMDYIHLLKLNLN